MLPHWLPEDGDHDGDHGVDDDASSHASCSSSFQSQACDGGDADDVDNDDDGHHQYQFPPDNDRDARLVKVWSDKVDHFLSLARHRHRRHHYVHLQHHQGHRHGQ